MTAPAAEVSIVVACTRPRRVAAIADALATQGTEAICELIVAGDVGSLDASRFAVPTTLVAVDDPHPNARRRDALLRCTAPVVAFLDDDAVPGPGWLAAAAEMTTDRREFWTGPETPVRRSVGAALAFAVSSSMVAEGTRAHTNGRETTVGFSEVPFCNLVATMAVLDEIGGLPVDIPWDMDDFELCQRAARAGVTFRNRSRLRIAHDRYPDSIVEWFALKGRARFRTGEKVVTHPRVYLAVPGVVVATVASLAIPTAVATLSRRRNGRRVLGVATALYAALVTAATVAAPRVSREGTRVSKTSFAATLAGLHLVSLGGMAGGIVTAACRRLLRREVGPAAGVIGGDGTVTP